MTDALVEHMWNTYGDEEDEDIEFYLRSSVCPKKRRERKRMVRGEGGRGRKREENLGS